MNRFTSLIAAVAIACAALAPAAATAATPKPGSFSGDIAKGGSGAAVSLGVFDRDTISSLSLTWACGGKGAADHTTNLVVDSELRDAVAIEDGAFTLTRKGATTVGDPFDPADRRDAGKATVTIKGRFAAPSKVVGTVSAKLGGCKLATTSFTAVDR